MPANITNTPLGNPFINPGDTRPDFRTPPAGNPFAGPPEPPRTPEQAKLAAAHRARGEWREYLPHGLPRADYEPYRQTHIRAAAISSATTPLKAALPAEEVAPCAEEIADAAFVSLADLLTTYEPD